MVVVGIISTLSFPCLVFLIDHLLTYPYEKYFPKMLIFQIALSVYRPKDLNVRGLNKE